MHYRSLAKRVGNAVRLAEVVQVLVRHGFADVVRRLGLHEGLPAKVLRGLRLIEAPSGEPETAGRRMRAALTELGPTAVKFGQILSTRPDIVGRTLAQDLEHLQDRVEAIPFEDMRPIIEEELGGVIDDLYAEFDRTPVAAASLSQVYRGASKSGAQVAVKVQRPGIMQVIESDLNLMHGIAEWVAEHVQEAEFLDPVGVVEEFRRSILRELDFTVEARVIERFRRHSEDIPELFVPQVYPDLSSTRVMTMDWIDGIRLDAIDQYAERNCDPRVVAKIGCDVFCRQVFDLHLFHADPHPGNILVMRNNQIAFLDYGMVGSLERTDVIVMADLLRAIFQENAEQCVQALLAFTTAGDLDNREALVHEVAEYIAFDAQAMVGGGEIGKAIERLSSILQRYRLQLAPRFSLMLKALATIESTAHVLDPDLDIVPLIKPQVERIVLERYAPGLLMQEARNNLGLLMRLGREIPTDVRNVLRMLRRGKFKVQVNHEGLSHFAGVTDRASNRITFGLITGSIIVGSSLLITTGEGARTLGMAGYIVAGVLGLGLVISILRSRNF